MQDLSPQIAPPSLIFQQEPRPRHPHHTPKSYLPPVSRDLSPVPCPPFPPTFLTCPLTLHNVRQSSPSTPSTTTIKFPTALNIPTYSHPQPPPSQSHFYHFLIESACCPRVSKSSPPLLYLIVISTRYLPSSCIHGFSLISRYLCFICLVLVRFISSRFAISFYVHICDRSVRLSEGSYLTLQAKKRKERKKGVDDTIRYDSLEFNCLLEACTGSFLMK